MTASHLLELAKNARSIFQSSQPAQKNKILKALLANCQINEKRLQLNLLKPFSVLVESTLSQNWLRVQVTNSLTGVECYKWDTTERVLAIPKIILSEDEKARLIRYFGVLIEMDRGQSDQ